MEDLNSFKTYFETRKLSFYFGSLMVKIMGIKELLYINLN